MKKFCKSNDFIIRYKTCSNLNATYTISLNKNTGHLHLRRQVRLRQLQAAARQVNAFSTYILFPVKIIDFHELHLKMLIISFFLTLA